MKGCCFHLENIGVFVSAITAAQCNHLAKPHKVHCMARRDTYPNQHVGITVRAQIYRWKERDAAGVPQVQTPRIAWSFIPFALFTGWRGEVRSSS